MSVTRTPSPFTSPPLTPGHAAYCGLERIDVGPVRGPLLSAPGNEALRWLLSIRQVEQHGDGQTLS